MAKNDREIMEKIVAEAEAFWITQKRLIAEGIIDRQSIAIAMGKLNEAHMKASLLGLRDLLEPQAAKKLKVNLLWD